MKRMLAKGTVVLVVSLFTLGAAQETTPQSSDGMTMGQGMMGQGMMGEQQGMMAMMAMMQACSSMMQAMQGEQMGMMGGQMDMNKMDTGMAATSARIDETAAEALARAFLTGRDSAAAVTLQNVLSTEGGYTVQYLQGDTSGKLSVDATTGEVQPQTSE